MKGGVENYEGCDAMQSLRRARARTKMPANFERHRFDRVTRAYQSLTNKVKYSKYSTVKCKHILAVLLCFVKISGESCVEKYKKLNGVDLSTTRARRKVLASFEAGMNSPVLP